MSRASEAGVSHHSMAFNSVPVPVINITVDHSSTPVFFLQWGLPYYYAWDLAWDSSNYFDFCNNKYSPVLHTKC